jgi:hypothetical protein
VQSLDFAAAMREKGKARKPLAVCKASFTLDSGYLFGRKKAATSCPHGLYLTKVGGINVCKACLPGAILKGAPARHHLIATDNVQVLMATSAFCEQLQSLAEIFFHFNGHFMLRCYTRTGSASGVALWRQDQRAGQVAGGTRYPYPCRKSLLTCHM